ncbi:hypothetical protein GOP47_0003229 [Adiantum capillus-veneris]|uniref:Uncharacterized protein n=1 Tax=Adiantum capillus-veneris TaxID=13818 RepID=A0A9D4ZRM6_ADICA|nr:hypothetical protein GOP47_0003229 [Adiantum capillus-veneris]
MDTPSSDMMRSYSVRSDAEVSCCWATRRQPIQREPTSFCRSARVVPVSAQSFTASDAPRLTRCHAIRRDLFNDWNFEDFMAGCA